MWWNNLQKKDSPYALVYHPKKKKGNKTSKQCRTLFIRLGKTEISIARIVHTKTKAHRKPFALRL